MPIFSRFFGRRPGSDPDPRPAAEPERYKGFDIHPEPIREGSQWRICARIEREVGGALKSHRLIRADTVGDADAAVAESLRKARRVIDERGEALFESAR